MTNVERRMREQADQGNPWAAAIVQETEAERLAHGICDALKFLPPPSENGGTAILRGLLIGTSHEGHEPEDWRSPYA